MESEKYDRRFHITKHPREPAITDTPREAANALRIKSSISINTLYRETLCRSYKARKDKENDL